MMAGRPKPTTLGPLAPRISFWDFATRICGLGERGSKVQPTVAQCAILKSYDRRVALTRSERRAYRQLTGKAAWKVDSKAPPFICLALSRGGGKTLMLATIAAYEAVSNPYEAAPGEPVAVVNLGARLKQAKDLMRYLKAHFERPALEPLFESGVTDEIRLINGRSIRCVAVDKKGGAARGPTYLCSLIDESAFLSHDGVIVDKDNWQAILAGARGVSDFRGVLSSTPAGKTGFFYETFEDNFEKTGTAWETFRGPVDLIRPDMDKGLLREYERADSDAYRREFLCDFSAGSSEASFFSQITVEGAVSKGVRRIAPGGPCSAYIAAVDPSGGRADVFTLTVVERLDDGSMRQCLCAGWDPKREQTQTVHEVARKIRDLLQPYNIIRVIGDFYGGNWVTEGFRAAGIEYEGRPFNAPAKLQRAAALRESLASGRLALLDHHEQARELVEYESRPLPSGGLTVGHPNRAGASDDYLDALGLAVFELLGHDEATRPPDELLTDSPSDKGKLFTAGRWKHPGSRDRLRGLFVPAAEIAEEGKGPAWIIGNVFKNPRTALASVTELAWHSQLGPYQLMVFFGREIILQHAWMRWILSLHQDNSKGVEIISGLGNFPGIPAWPAIKRRILEKGSIAAVARFKRIASYEVSLGTEPGDLYGMTSPRIGRRSAWPPWTKADSRWGVFPADSKYVRGWPDQPWADHVEDIFYRGAAEREAYQLRVGSVQHDDEIAESPRVLRRTL